MKKLLPVLLLLGVLAACDSLTPADEILDLDIPEVKLPYTLNGSHTVSFYAREPWEIDVTGSTRAVSWLKVDPESGDPGNVTMTLTVTEANTGSQPRSAKVFVTAGTATKSFTVTQHSESSQNDEGNDDDDDEPIVSDRTFKLLLDPVTHISAADQLFSVRAVSPDPIELIISDATSYWVKYLPTRSAMSESGEMFLLEQQLVVSRNVSGTERTGYFQVASGGKYIDFSLVQSADGGDDRPEVPADILTVTNGRQHNLSADAQILELRVSASIPYDILVESGFEWLRPYEDGTEPQANVHRFAISENTTGSNREARMHLAAVYNGLPVRVDIIVSQGTTNNTGELEKLFTYHGTEKVDFPQVGGSENLKIEIHHPNVMIGIMDYAERIDWLNSELVKEGDSYYTIKLTAQPNTTGSPRSFDFRFMGSYGQSRMDYLVPIAQD